MLLLVYLYMYSCQPAGSALSRAVSRCQPGTSSSAGPSLLPQVLFFAASGNNATEGDNGGWYSPAIFTNVSQLPGIDVAPGLPSATRMPCSPAGAWATRRCPRLRVSVQVISVGATQHPNNTRADFSTWNLDVELTAPGNAVLSTLAKSDYGRMDTGVQVTTKPAAAADLTFPAPKPANGSSYGAVTAPLVDCGLGTAACTGAKGKGCLIQRGGSKFCEKVINCQSAGGLAAILYNSDTAGPCDTVTPSLESSGADTCNDRTKYIPTVALTLQQGRAIKALIAASKGAATATVTVPDPVEYAKRVGGLPGPNTDSIRQSLQAHLLMC